MEQKPSEITAALDEFLTPFLFPDKGDGSDPRLCPACGEGRLALRGGRYGAFVACSNYPECKFTRRFAQGGEGGAEDNGPAILGQHPETGEDITRKSGRFGPYIEMGSGKAAKRSSIPKDDRALEPDLAVKLPSMHRTTATHPHPGHTTTPTHP